MKRDSWLSYPHKLLQSSRSNRTLRKEKFLQKVVSFRTDDSFDQGSESFVVNTISIFDRTRISQVNTREGGVFKDEIKDFLLLFATVDAIVFDFQTNDSAIVGQSFHKEPQSGTQIVHRHVKLTDLVVFTQNFGQTFCRMSPETHLFQNELMWDHLLNKICESSELQVNIWR